MLIPLFYLKCAFLLAQTLLFVSHHISPEHPWTRWKHNSTTWLMGGNVLGNGVRKRHLCWSAKIIGYYLFPLCTGNIHVGYWFCADGSSEHSNLGGSATIYTMVFMRVYLRVYMMVYLRVYLKVYMMVYLMVNMWVYLVVYVMSFMRVYFMV